MKKLTAQEINKELANKEMSFTELDNYMMNNGYQTVFNDGATKEIKEDLNVIYTAADTCECEIQINFKIAINNAEDYVEEDFILKVDGVYEF